MSSVPLEQSLFLAVILFAIGLVGVLVRRDIVFVLFSIEIMLNASGLAFIAAGARWHSPDGQVLFLFILATAASEVAIGLALALRLYHRFGSVDIDAASQMRG